jgi:DNA polymerase I
MTMNTLLQILLNLFLEIWCVDFEFHQPEGDRPEPLCISALELRSGRLIKLWLPDADLGAAPFTVDKSAVMVTFMGTAELNCFLSLGWAFPTFHLDLYVEERAYTNGRVLDPAHLGRSLLDVLGRYGLSHGVSAERKQAMRELAIRGGPYTEQERRDLMDYCDTDVFALRDLIGVMSPLDMQRALHRGECMKSFARIEHEGVPIDTATLDVFRNRWGDIRLQTAILASARFEGVYEGLHFREDNFRRYLDKRKISWPRLMTGRLKLDDDTFRDMTRVHPRLQLLKDARKTLSRLQINVQVGRDGRNRVMLSPFSTKTSRCSPSTTKFIFSQGRWLRPMVWPEPGMAIGYADWSQQEFGAAAYFSGDGAMMAAYRSGDPYMAFAVMAGAAPAGATKDTHEHIRNIYKTTTLAVGYGQSAHSLGVVLGIPTIEAQDLLLLHRRLYPAFWRWSANVSATARLRRKITTRTLWPLHVSPLSDNERSLRNFPVQASGADMLRFACILGHERGVRICATVHDAVAIVAPVADIEDHIDRMRCAMRDASALILDGFELDTDYKIVRHPERFPVTETWIEVLKMVGLGS